MYSYNLIIKHGGLDHAAARALVNRELTTRFGPDVHYTEHAYLSNEIVVVISDEGKRNLQGILGDWFNEPPRTLDRERNSSYPAGTLLHYREILPSESRHIRNQLGG